MQVMMVAAEQIHKFSGNFSGTLIGQLQRNASKLAMRNFNIPQDNDPKQTMF